MVDGSKSVSYKAVGCGLNFRVRTSLKTVMNIFIFKPGSRSGS